MPRYKKQKKLHEVLRENNKKIKQMNRRSGSVMTPDGEGKSLGLHQDSHMNHKVRVRLLDGRIRHYSPSAVTEI